MNQPSHKPYERFGRAIMIILLTCILIGLIDMRRRQDAILRELRTWQTHQQVEQTLQSFR